jgi:mRNA-degrading endonuclease RelE of RelBE toxin-antitoxin system
MKNIREIHFGHFVLIFEIDYRQGVVKILDFDHHDKIF